MELYNTIWNFPLVDGAYRMPIGTFRSLIKDGTLTKEELADNNYLMFHSFVQPGCLEKFALIFETFDCVNPLSDGYDMDADTLRVVAERGDWDIISYAINKYYPTNRIPLCITIMQYAESSQRHDIIKKIKQYVADRTHFI